MFICECCVIGNAAVCAMVRKNTQQLIFLRCSVNMLSKLCGTHMKMLILQRWAKHPIPLLSSTGNCAHFHKGGWWYNACGQANLNGVWYTGGVYRSKFQDGIFWADYGGGFYSMKCVRIMIRPIDWRDTVSQAGPRAAMEARSHFILHLVYVIRNWLIQDIKRTTPRKIITHQ